jgi:hypothetical protein
MSAKGKPVFEQCMELVQQGVNSEDAEYQKLYGALSPEKRDLVDSARRMLPKLRIEEDARQAATAIREAVAPGGKLLPQQMWAPCAPMPTDMCRISPFFPAARQKIKPRVWIEDLIITSNNWGTIKYSGPKLSTYEEDVLLAILALLDSKKNLFHDQMDGKPTYTYRGPLLPVLKLMGYKTVGKTDYKHVIDSLKVMRTTALEMNIYGRTARGKHKVSIVDISGILSHARWNEEKKLLEVTIDPYFYEQYIAGSVTLIDVVERAKLKSPIAKSLMRFLQSHRDQKWGPAHYLTLAKTLNLDLDQPPIQLRRLLKGAISELVKTGWLSAGGFEGRDLVSLTRSVDTNRRRLTS